MDPSASRTKEISKDLSLLSVEGVSAWNIAPMTLLITFGRYKNTIPVAFKTVKNLQKIIICMDAVANSLEARKDSH